MRFMTCWTFKPEASRAAIARFKETGGFPPEGVTMVVRYHDVAGNRGWAISECDDPVAASKWCHDWSDLLTFEVTPVLDDQQITEVLKDI